MLSRPRFTEAIYQYVFDISVQETDCLRRLREETAAMPMAEMQIPPEQGQFLAFLTGLTGARKALEVGVFTGYGTLWTAMVLQADGLLVACDISKEWTDIARRYWREAGVEDRIDLRLGPAIDTLADLLREGHGGTFDCIFLDSDKNNYLSYYEACFELLRPGGLLAIDNMLRAGEVIDPSVSEEGTVQVRLLNKRIQSDGRVLSCLLPVADGIQLVMKRPP